MNVFNAVLISLDLFFLLISNIRGKGSALFLRKQEWYVKYVTCLRRDKVEALRWTEFNESLGTMFPLSSALLPRIIFI